MPGSGGLLGESTGRPVVDDDRPPPRSRSSARPSSASSDASALTPYLPRLAISWAEEHPDRSWLALSGSLVFVDVSGFTALSERLARRGPIGAEELSDILGRCFADLLAVAYADGGSLIKFGGDALLLLFDGEGHEERACRSAMRMRVRLRTAGRLTTTVGNVRLRMSVGVHSGELHLFRVGGSHHELLIAGPGASTVVAMESIADAGEILVSPATALAVDGRILGEEKGPGRLLRNSAVDGPVPGSFPPAAAADAVDMCIPIALRGHLLSGGGESEHRQVSVGFLHFDGTDEVLEHEGPSTVAVALDGLVRAVQEAADDEGVTFLATDIDRDGGKIILATGVPSAFEDGEGRLLRCLHRVVGTAHALPIRAGVNAGRVFAGSIGPDYRRTYTVMGDAVNLAARLMAKAEPGQVIASAGVLERSSTAFGIEPLPAFHVKGKAKPVTAFAVLDPSGDQLHQSTLELPFVGRERELQSLVEALAGLDQGAGSVADIVGDAGIGKSRLVEELLLQLERATAVVVRCHQHESTTPFFAVRELLNALLPASDGDRLGALQRGLCELLPTAVDWLPLVADVFGIDAPETALTADLQPQFRRQRTVDVVLDIVAAALPRPSVIVFEDVHWSDDASADLLRQLAGTADQRPWLLCITRRPEAGRELDLGGPVTSRVELGPLDVSASEMLVTGVARTTPIVLHRRSAIVERAGGNPMFLEQLLVAEREGHADDDAPLPESLESLLAAQIDRLGPIDRRVVRYAAVLGSSFAVTVLAELVAPEGVDGVSAIKRLRSVLQPEGQGRVRFRHRLLRDVAYQALPYRTRRAVHGRAAEVIQRTSADDPERAAVLSLHFLHAERYERCWRYATTAATWAQQKYANVEAVELYERALTAARHVPDLTDDDVVGVWEELASVAELAGMYGRAGRAYREARRLRADDPVAVARLYRKQAGTADRSGSRLAASRWLKKGLRLLADAEDADGVAERARLRARYAWTRQAQGKHRVAVRWCELAIEDASATGTRDALAESYLVLDFAHLAMGRVDLVTKLPEALSIYEELGDRLNQAIVLQYLGYVAQSAGRWSEAVELYTRSVEANLRVGNAVDAGPGAVNTAEILIDQGRLDEAETILLDQRDIWDAVGYRYGVGVIDGLLGRAALKRQQLDEAATRLREARQIFEAQALHVEVVNADAWLAECHLRRGDVDGAVVLLDAALQSEKAMGSTERTAMLHRLRGYAAASRDDFVTAWAELDNSLAVARARGASFDVALALEAFAVLAERGGRPVDGDIDAERRRILHELGVQATSPPPLPPPPADGDLVSAIG